MGRMGIALVVLLAGCAARPLEPFAVSAEPLTASDLGEARDLDTPAACTAPGAEETAAAVKLAWVAIAVPGNTPRVVWTCNCREFDIWCRLYYGDDDPLTITWYARVDADDRLVQPTRISESKLAFALALHAQDRGAVLEPHAVGAEVNRVLVAAGY